MVFLADLDFDFEDVVFKVAFFARAVRENHLAVAVLNSSDPLTMVAATVRPVHFSIAISLVFFVFSLVDVAAGPLEDAIPMLSIIIVVTLVAVALGSACTSPFAFTLFHSSFEITHVAGTVCPGVLAFSIGLAVYVLARVRVSVNKYIGACAVL